jgi:type VI secretion system protein ImpA
MASPEVLDFPLLLNPIPGDKPGGADLRAGAVADSLYYLVKDARSAARAAERHLVVGEDGGGAPPPDWQAVLESATRALAEHSKDLEIAAYLIEALVRLHGFAGLRDGFRLARGLVEQFWDGLYPLPDEDALATRVAPLTGLNGENAEGTLIAPIAQVPLTDGAGAGPFSQYHYLRATAISQIPDEEAREKQVRRGAVPLAAIEQAVAETPSRFFVALVGDLEQCREEFARLQGTLEERCGAQAPPGSKIRAALESCLEAVRALARDKLALAEAAAGAAEGEAATEADGAPADGPAGRALGEPAGTIRSRGEAFQALLKVAEYFRRTEPHTPVSYALEQAARWGRMSLPELLTELIPEESSREFFFRQVGIRGAHQASG